MLKVQHGGIVTNIVPDAHYVKTEVCNCLNLYNGKFSGREKQNESGHLLPEIKKHF
jgi:hypothetical protein